MGIVEQLIHSILFVFLKSVKVYEFALGANSSFIFGPRAFIFAQLPIQLCL